jgi:hypothetical protein
VKYGVGASGFVAQRSGRTVEGQGRIPDMVTIQVNNLIDFVAEVFSARAVGVSEASIQRQ